MVKGEGSSEQHRFEKNVLEDWGMGKQGENA